MGNLTALSYFRWMILNNKVITKNIFIAIAAKGRHQKKICKTSHLAQSSLDPQPLGHFTPEKFAPEMLAITPSPI